METNQKLKRGRKPNSRIRQNLVEMLYFLESINGYEAYKMYMSIFDSCSQRSIYYHLSRGIETNEFCIDSVQTQTGDFSWGKNSQHVYYRLGKSAKPQIKKSVQEAVNLYQRQKKKKLDEDVYK